MEKLFSSLTHSVEGAPAVAFAAAFAWGILSVVLSPCHLASIPLIVGFIDDQGRMSTKRAFVISTLFSLGILVTIGVVAAIGGLRDESEAREVLAWLKKHVGSISDRRSEIRPSYESIGQVKALDVFKLLPKTNCGRCGPPTCLAFAAAVAKMEKEIAECAPLFSGSFEKQRLALQSLLGSVE